VLVVLSVTVNVLFVGDDGKAFDVKEELHRGSVAISHKLLLVQ